MGKFYFDNKHKWFEHQAKRAHQKKMREGGSLAGAADVADELRFFLGDERTAAPKNVRISEHNLDQLAVINGNGFIGLLDDPSTAAMRAFFKANGYLAGMCPATVVGREEWSGAYIIKLGTEK